MFSVIKKDETEAMRRGLLKTGNVLIQAVCLYTDSKPTDGIANGSICIEMDTGKIFMFNEAGSAWVELQ